jgi:cell division protein FtsW
MDRWRLPRERARIGSTARGTTKRGGRAAKWGSRSGEDRPARGARDRARRNATAREESAAAGGPLDGGLVASTAILLGIGIVMVYSTTAPLAMGSTLPPHFIRHLVAVAVGITCIAVVVRVPIPVWRRLALPLWGLGMVLLILTLVAGTSVNGGQRWLAVPGTGLRLQAAEFVKWATALAVVAVGAHLAERRIGSNRAMLLAAGLMLPPVGLLLLQPDFGSALVMVASVGLVLFVAGVPLRRLLLPAAIVMVGAAGYIALHPYALKRLRGFIDPWETARHEGFQLVQSFVAFGRGGSFGVGIGDGRQKLFYLPEAHTDFVLSVVAEESGLLGVLVVLGAFAALIVAGCRVAARARNPFCQLLAFAMTALIAVPAAINAAVVMGLLPTTGFTLPFISFGANSLVICSVAIGILLRIASHDVTVSRRRIASASHRGLLQT